MIFRFDRIYRDGIIQKLKEIKEYEIFIVGGYLRDFLLGRKSRDLDIAVYGDAKKFASLFGNPFKLKEEFDEWRVIVNGGIIDVLGLEKDIIYDLKRRDFTINSMAMNIKSLDFFDPFDGIRDLKSGIIKANSAENIKEDPVRILRGLRMMCELGFTIEDNTLKIFKEYANLIKNSAPERIHQELVFIFSSSDSYKSIIPEIYDIIFPGFLKMKEIKGSINSEYSLLEHSIFSLKYLENIIKDEELLKNFRKHIKRYVKDKVYLLRIATLLHDIKKPDTMIIDDKIHFYGHDKEAAEWFKRTGKALRFSNREIDYIYNILKNHMWLHLLSATQITEKAIRRIIFKMGEDIIGLILFTFADEMASGGENIKRVLETSEKILNYYYTKRKQIKPVIMGRDIIKHLKLKEGPEIGRLIRIAQAAYIEGIVKNKKEAIKFLKDYKKRSNYE